MKKMMQAIVTETATYVIDFEVSTTWDADEIEQAARDEWDANPARKPDDYLCEIDVLRDTSRA